MEKKSVSPEQMAAALIEHMKSVLPPTKQAKEVIARVRKGGDENMLELDISKMLAEYFAETVKLRDSTPEVLKKMLGK